MTSRPVGEPLAEPISAEVYAATPLYGTWVIFTPAIAAITSADRWAMLPGPEDP